MEILTPGNLKEAMQLKQAYPEAALLAGGTDLLVKQRQGMARDLAIYLGGLTLNFIVKHGDVLRIGSGCTHAQIAASELVRKYAWALAEACENIGSAQIRNAGTLGGNLATASPAGDTILALYGLGATVVVDSMEWSREIEVEKFFTGPGETVLYPREIITEVWIPCLTEKESSFFRRLGGRNAMAISIAGVAGRVAWDEQGKGFDQVRIALGSVGPTVILAQGAAECLTGKPLDKVLLAEAAARVKQACRPISDVRGSAVYRREMAGNLLIEQVSQLLAERGGEVIGW